MNNKKMKKYTLDSSFIYDGLKPTSPLSNPIALTEAMKRNYLIWPLNNQIDQRKYLTKQNRNVRNTVLRTETENSIK